MIDIIIQILLESWEILLDSSAYILFGFLVAGLLKAFLPENLVSGHLGGGNLSSVVKASAIGVPIPLCSCGVLPAAAGLREQGASKGAASSFLISTPETGVDSIAISYALLDPIMTVIRPVAAFITAITTGVFVNLTDKKEDKIEAPPEPFKKAASGCGCGCSHESEKKPENKSIVAKMKGGLSFAFGELFDDVGRWFIVGVLIAGAITVFISPELIEAYLGEGMLSMIVMLAIAIPLYVCATASTPIAAALALKGLSPGAALVFLLAGPATNAASLTVISKILGKRATVIYLSVIIVMTLVMGFAVNYLYNYLGLDITGWVNGGSEESKGIVEIASSLIIILMVLKSFLPGRAGSHDHDHDNDHGTIHIQPESIVK